MSLIDGIPHPSPYLSSPACVVCHMPSAWLSIYSGRRCDTHAPQYDPQVAVGILMAGWPGTAASYVRAWGVAS